MTTRVPGALRDDSLVMILARAAAFAVYASVASRLVLKVATAIAPGRAPEERTSRLLDVSVSWWVFACVLALLGVAYVRKAGFHFLAEYAIAVAARLGGAAVAAVVLSVGCCSADVRGALLRLLAIFFLVAPAHAALTLPKKRRDVRNSDNSSED